MISFDKINVLLFDVDGVLTNGNILITESGEMLRTMHVKDGYAIKKALEYGYHIGVITGGTSKGVVERCKFLGIKDVYHSVRDKMEILDLFEAMYDYDRKEFLYMGDDFPDYDIMKAVGYPTCPADAAPEIQQISKYISPVKGGEGCVRDVIFKCMRSRNLAV